MVGRTDDVDHRPSLPPPATPLVVIVTALLLQRLRICRDGVAVSNSSLMFFYEDGSTQQTERHSVSTPPPLVGGRHGGKADDVGRGRCDEAVGRLRQPGQAAVVRGENGRLSVDVPYQVVVPAQRSNRWRVLSCGTVPQSARIAFERRAGGGSTEWGLAQTKAFPHQLMPYRSR